LSISLSPSGLLLLSSLLSLTLSSDDPYYYLYYGKDPRYPSYFSLEREEPEVGRVVRFDSLSKILSAGVRIGFASGPEKLLDAIDLYVSFKPLQLRWGLACPCALGHRVYVTLQTFVDRRLFLSLV
jgi:hypothetical protein